MAAIVLGGLAVTVGVASVMYRRNLIARRRYVFVQSASATHQPSPIDRVDRQSTSS
jgi:hypothetical protein